jgi:hypothetical protein
MNEEARTAFQSLAAEVRALIALARARTPASSDEWRIERLTLLAEVASTVDCEGPVLRRRDLGLLEAILQASFEALEGMKVPDEVGVKLTALRTRYNDERGRLFPKTQRGLEQLESDFYSPVRTPTRIFRRQRRRLQELAIDYGSGQYRVH